MSDRVCIRGCKQQGVHYASCDDYGMQEAYERAIAAGVPRAAYTPQCSGCAETPARDRVMICERCYRRMRGILYDAPDLIGRLRSLADPMKATPTDQHRSGGGSVEAPAPIDSDVLDALNDVVTTWGAWQNYAHPQTLVGALDGLLNDHQHVEDLWTGFLQRHELVDGIREFWSFADVRAKWGAERRTKGEREWEPDEELDPVADAPSAIAEYSNPLLTKVQAEEFAGSARTLQRWRAKELIAPERTVSIAGVRTSMFRLADLARVRDEMKVGRPRAVAAQKKAGD